MVPVQHLLCLNQLVQFMIHIDTHNENSEQMKTPAEVLLISIGCDSTMNDSPPSLEIFIPRIQLSAIQDIQEESVVRIYSPSILLERLTDKATKHQRRLSPSQVREVVKILTQSRELSARERSVGETGAVSAVPFTTVPFQTRKCKNQKDKAEDGNGTPINLCFSCGRLLRFISLEVHLKTCWGRLHELRKCYYCSNFPLNSNTVVAHINQYHSSGPKYRCVSCSSRFTIFRELENHIRYSCTKLAAGDSSRMEAEPLLEEDGVILEKSELKTGVKVSTDACHLKLLFGDRGRAKMKECPLCLRHFRRNRFPHHAKVCNRGPPRICCPYNSCTAMFREKSNMEKHLKLHHHNEKKYDCKKCKKAYATERSLIRHLRRGSCVFHRKRIVEVERLRCEISKAGAFQGTKNKTSRGIRLAKSSSLNNSDEVNIPHLHGSAASDEDEKLKVDSQNTILGNSINDNILIKLEEDLMVQENIRLTDSVFI